MTAQEPDGARRPVTGPQLTVQLVLGGAAGVALAFLLGPFLPALVTASVLALILYPVHRRLCRKTGRADVAAGLLTLAGVLLIATPVVLVGALVLREFAEAMEWIAREGPAAIGFLPELERTLNRWAAALGLPGLDLGAAVAGRLRAAPRILMGRAGGLVAGVGGFALQTGVALFALFFLLRDGDQVEGLLRSLIPLDREGTDALLGRGREVVSATVYGHLTVALVQGTLGGLAFWALGLPGPFLWGTLMGALSLVPLVGPGVVWLPAGVLLIGTGAVFRGIVLLVFGVLVISTVDNVIRAVLVGTRARVHPLAVFLGVLGGLLLFGAVGIFVGPVVLVVSLLLLEMLRESIFRDSDGGGGEGAPAR